MLQSKARGGNASVPTDMSKFQGSYSTLINPAAALGLHTAHADILIDFVTGALLASCGRDAAPAVRIQVR